MKLWRERILIRLLGYFLLLAIVPLTLVGAIAYNQGQRALQQHILDHLTTTAILKEGEINRWVEDEVGDTILLAHEPVFQEYAGTLLTQDSSDPEFVSAYQTLKSYLNGVLAQKSDFLEVLMLRGVGGEVVLSTNDAHEGNYEVTSSFFTEGRKGTYVQNVYPSVSLGGLAMTLATPVMDDDGQVLGVVAVHLNLAKLDDIMLERGGLGTTGETYLVDQFNVFVSQARFGSESFPRGAHTAGIDAALLDKRDGAGAYDNYQGVPVLGAYRWMEEREMALLAEIEQGEALAPVHRLAWVILLVGLVVAGAVAAIAYGVSRQISSPILAMAKTSEQMAKGDLTQSVNIQRQDEIGTLAQALNSMATQLRSLIGSLEQRVADRTRDVERRAVQLETAADVGRAAASILELEALTRQVVELIRDRFDLYYVGLFLVDDAGQYAVLEAGTGEPGRLMKAQGHKLRIGGVSMVGSACAQKKAHIALDVGVEAVRFDNPLLPDTRSEMALPLMVGDRVLGALDVQSTQPAAFSQEDIAVLQLMADQVAVAVDNARKFSEEAALVEATNPLFRVSRRLSAATTTDDVVEAITTSVAETEADGCAIARFAFVNDSEDQPATLTFVGSWARQGRAPFPIGLTLPVGESHLPWDLMATSWMSENLAEDARLPDSTRESFLRQGNRSVVNIPIHSGERVTGFVAVYRTTVGPFSPVSIRLFEALTDLAAVALERAALLEDAQRRAAQEQLVGEVTGRFRETLDVDTVLKTAAQEMRQALGLARLTVQLAAKPDEPNRD